MSTTALLTMSLRITDGDMNTDSTPPVFVVQKTIAGITAYEHKRRIVNDATVTMWSSSATGEALTDFDLAVLWVETGSVEVELTCNDGDAAEAIFTVTADCPLVLGDFDLAVLWIETGSVEVELTCNDGDAAEAIFTVTVPADCPLVLGDDASRYNTGALTGTADVIDLIRVKNAAATDVVVHLLLAT